MGKVIFHEVEKGDWTLGLLEAAQKDKMEGFARGPIKGTELFLLTLSGICELMITEGDGKRCVTRFQY